MTELEQLREEVARLRKGWNEVSLIARFADRSAGPTGSMMALERIVKVLNKYDPIPEPIEPEETTDVQRPPRKPPPCTCARPTVRGPILPGSTCRVCGGVP